MIFVSLRTLSAIKCKRSLVNVIETTLIQYALKIHLMFSQYAGDCYITRITCVPLTQFVDPEKTLMVYLYQIMYAPHGKVWHTHETKTVCIIER